MHRGADGFRRQNGDRPRSGPVCAARREYGGAGHPLRTAHDEETAEASLVRVRFAAWKQPRHVARRDDIAPGAALVLHERQKADPCDGDPPAESRGRQMDVTRFRISEGHGEVGADRGHPHQRLVGGKARGHVDRNHERLPLGDEAHGARGKPVRRDGPLQASPEKSVHHDCGDAEGLEVVLLRDFAD